MRPLLALILVTLPTVVPATEGATSPPWRAVLERLRQRHAAMSYQLEVAHRDLLSRVAGDEALVERLRPEPERPRPRGYGIVPSIDEEDVVTPEGPTERVYALHKLELGVDADLRAATELAAQAADEPPEPLVDEYERLRERLTTIENHLDYHAYWQTAVVEYRDFFASKNAIVAEVREMQARTERGETASAAELRRKVLAQIAPFNRTPGLRLVELEPGRRSLHVEVVTDILDERFLEVFEQAVTDVWTDSEVARDAGIVVRMELRGIAVGELYPRQPPSPGQAIDVELHLSRFAAGTLVLTTGAESTHARMSRAILLGPSPLSRRALAHEFGHLLGFSDAYLRGFDGDPAGPYGASLVEWSGLQLDLMGDTRNGRVTTEMIEVLIGVYGAE